MITSEMIQRINALARKQKTEGLTPQEENEQARLRQAYLKAIRGAVKQQLDRVKIVDGDQSN